VIPRGLWLLKILELAPVADGDPLIDLDHARAQLGLRKGTVELALELPPKAEPLVIEDTDRPGRTVRFFGAFNLACRLRILGSIGKREVPAETWLAQRPA